MPVPQSNLTLVEQAGKPVHKNGTRCELVNLLSKLAWQSNDRNLIYRQKCAQCAIDLLLGAKNGPTAGMRSNTAPNDVVAAVWRLKIKNLEQVARTKLRLQRKNFRLLGYKLWHRNKCNQS
ncbi:hypothetical protein [Microcoleus sp. B5-D4]